MHTHVVYERVAGAIPRVVALSRFLLGLIVATHRLTVMNGVLLRVWPRRDAWC